MTFPVHRSDEPTARERGEAFGRAQAQAVQHTVATYKRMFAAADTTIPDTIAIPEPAARRDRGDRGRRAS